MKKEDFKPMCEINAYVAESDEKYLEGVDLVRVLDGGTVYMKNLFGEERTFKGRIVEISFRRGRLTLAPA